MSVELPFLGVLKRRFWRSFGHAPSTETDRSDAPLVLCVARLVPNEGLDVLIHATALLVERRVNLRVEIIGEGPLRPVLEEQIRCAELERFITVRALKLRGEVRAAYRRSACVVLPSGTADDEGRDGLTITLADAMASGVAVVATRLPGISDLVVDGRTGLLVDPDDAVSLADALEHMLSDRDLRRQLARSGQARSKELFAGAPAPAATVAAD